MKLFSFHIKNGTSFGVYSFYAPCKNGYVITNYYCPRALLVNDTLPFAQAIIPEYGESEAEFIQDCNNIVKFANANPDQDVFYRLGQGLFQVIINHIHTFNRIYFKDLLIYMDCFSHLLKALDYADVEIRRVYPIITKRIVDVAQEYVLESRSTLPINTTCYYQYSVNSNVIV